MSGVIVTSPEALEQLVERAVERAMSRAGASGVLSVPEAARYAQRSVETVRGWIASGALTARKRGRVWAVRREDLDRYLAGERADAAPSVQALVASLAPKR